MLTVSGITAAIAAILLVALSLPVSFRRMAVGVDIGQGSDETLLRRIRAQGNFTEYVPLGLLLLVLNEFRGVSPGWLWCLAGLLIGGRLLHALGILAATRPFRAAGMLATYGCLLLGAGLLLAA
ncbi:hypothetical protein CXZ10_14085 [Pleomorphomonas diazotrophica]|uniref:MAPEG family protein n=1 Tax=Pleomorphomonas diazotrophica TaxID=1166257 RepID=A0A1I4STX9_9HYPH|nr:MAPEG family protein [Pleomorphomonas diazotrophica]PKR88527.1 hypothetical protein CXZ10_14085 [Pleomorphomonas diazotrophica]SFM67800.1 hypothetical protein SAMN05192571_104136 [Pleomorphomonas diazotrophica]